MRTLFTILVLAVVLFPLIANATTINIPGDCTTIQAGNDAAIESKNTTYYVSLSGNNNNNGTTPDSAWRTITYAATQAQAGDTVYIQAGDYGHEHVVMMNSGTAGNPIVFQGYQYTPGDTPEPYYEPGDELDPTVMPLINGTDRTGDGIYIQYKNYIELRNIQITLYFNGLDVMNCDYVKLDNILGIRFGGSDNQGFGVYVKYCAHCEIRNCTMTDAAHASFILTSSHYNVMESCEAHSVDEYGEYATDYYIVIYESHDNTVRHCLAQNHHTLAPLPTYWGHGIGVKRGYNNRIIDCVARGCAKGFYVSRPNAHDNEIINCTAFDDSLSQVVPASDGPGALVVRDSAYNNTFIGCRGVGTRNGIWFWDSGGSWGGGTRNTFSNCILEDVETGIHLEEAYDNIFENCVITDAENLFGFSFSNNNNNMRNSIVTDISNYDNGTGVVAVTYSDFYNNGFATPYGTGNMEEDPIFAGPYNQDFYLRWHSPCIDAGDPDPTYNDPDGTRNDMGAFYFNQAVDGIVEVYPHDEPIVIPPEGADITYDGWVFNFFGHPGRADIWTYAFVPEMGRYGAIDLYESVRIPADSIGMNEITQHVPGVAPQGDYVFVAYVGEYPSTITDSSCFYFTKTGSVADGIADWQSLKGWFRGDFLSTASGLPTHYALSRNYPNPFNARTTINYQLPADGHVKLEVYNTLGQKVVTLLDQREEAGYKSVNWDASRVSSGPYFYKLSAGDFSETRRMMLVK